MYATMHFLGGLALLVTVLAGGLATPATDDNSLTDAWSNFLHQSERALDSVLHHHNEAVEKHPKPCVGCGEGIDELRAQFVRNQILRKLRMKDRPSIAKDASKPLPPPVAAGATMLLPSFPGDPDSQLPDDFYAKTDQKIILADADERLGKCEGNLLGKTLYHPTSCFTFSMPRDLHPQDLSSAEMWIYKERDPLDNFKQTFVIMEAAHWDPKHLHRKTMPVAIHETDISEGWMKIDVRLASRAWLERQGSTGLVVSCLSCGAPLDTQPLALRPDRRPFLVINTRYSAKKRPPRQLECAVGVNECCRESLYVSFEELGWDDWILQPKGYQAYFCRGSCVSVAAVTLSGSHHQSVLKKLFHSGGPRRLELKPCCTPTTFSSLQLFYMDSNVTVTQKTLPNMVVESCGCM